jgi:hypothetical protein
MDEDEFRKQFSAVAAAFAAASPELQNQLLPEMKRLQLAHTEVNIKFDAGLEAAKQPDITSVFTTTKGAEYSLYDNTFDVVTNGLKPIVGAHPTPPEEAAYETADQTQLAEAFAAVQSAAFGLDIANFYYGMLLTTLHAAIAEYIDECETYLGRPVGSHKARKRIMKVVQEILLAIPGLFFPPLAVLDTGKEAWTQLKNSPRKVDKEIVRDATQTWEALLTFRDRLKEVHGHRWYTEGIVQTSVDAILQGIAPTPND